MKNIIRDVLTESEWDIGGKYRALQDDFEKMEMNNVVPIVNSFTRWDYEKITSLVEELLIDANFHTESKEVSNFMRNLP